MASVELRMDKQGVAAALSNPKAVAAMGEECRKIAARAEASGADYKTKRRYNDGVLVAGDKSPKFAARVRKGDDGAIGIVYTSNYAAIRFEHEHNALLRARG